MKLKFFQLIFIFGALTLGTAQDDSKKQSAVDPLDLKIGDEAPSFALMFAPGKTGLRWKAKSYERMLRSRTAMQLFLVFSLHGASRV